MERADPSSPEGLTWRISRHCNGGSCVQVASSGNVVYVSDSKDPGGSVLSYTKDEWHAFVLQIKGGNLTG
jgi:hypothetical protein